MIKQATNAIKTIAKSISKNPSSMRYIPKYIYSMLRSPLSMQIPWIPFSAIGWLEKKITPDSVIFEYGSGGSSIFYAKRAKRVYSVEHEKKWFNMIEKVLEENNLSNTNISYIPKDSKEDDYKKSFDQYASSIQKVPEKFDIVIVDGRNRVECIKRALPQVKKGGYLILDNSYRKRYNEAFKLLKQYKKIHFFGMTPHLTTPSKTTAFKIE